MADMVTGGGQQATDMRLGTNPGARVEVTEDAVLVRHGDHITKLTTTTRRLRAIRISPVRTLTISGLGCLCGRWPGCGDSRTRLAGSCAGWLTTLVLAI